MSQLRKYEIKCENGAVAVRNINADFPQGWSYFRFDAIKSIVPVNVLGMGTRQADNNRKNPLRYDNKLQFVINFHDENESAPIKYNIEDVDNQLTWTNDFAGLEIAVAYLNTCMDVTPAAVRSLAAEKTAVSIDTGAASTIIPIGATEISIFNNGAVDATVNGTVCPPGVIREFGFSNPIAATIECVATGTQLLIDYMI